MFPALSTATPMGKFKLAEVAGPPSPQAFVLAAHGVPFPAIRLIMPLVESTSRISLSPLSAMKRLPLASKATPCGTVNSAEFAGRPSPQLGGAEQGWPGVPAKVNNASVRNRTTWLEVSAINTPGGVPVAATTTPFG